MNGFKLIKGFAWNVQLKPLIDAIHWEHRAIKLYGKEVLQPRLTSWMGGEDYTYSGVKHVAQPMPQDIKDMKGTIEAFTMAHFNSVLANLYRDGNDSVSWHSDDEIELGAEPVIASLSFGAIRDFKVRHKATKEITKFTLGHGDLLVMSGRSQADYQHCVPKTTKVSWPRLNLTFRLIT